MAITVQEKVPKIVLDILLMAIVFLPVPITRWAVYPFKRGFYCNDESISYPYKTDTISNGVLIGVGISLPLVVMLITEILTLKFNPEKLPEDTYKYESSCGSRIVPTGFVHFLVTYYRVAGVFLFGAAMCQTTTDILKYTIGRLRPHFFSVCEPRWSNFNCTEMGHYVYVTADVCAGDAAKIREARLSHPSGHASFSAYCMIYLVLYLQVRMPKVRFGRMLRPFIQVVFLYMFLYTCASRISDYKHHWSDVLGGALLGTAVVILVAFFISNLYKRPTISDINQHLERLHLLNKREDMNLDPPVAVATRTTSVYI